MLIQENSRRICLLDSAGKETEYYTETGIKTSKNTGGKHLYLESKLFSGSEYITLTVTAENKKAMSCYFEENIRELKAMELLGANRFVEYKDNNLIKENLRTELNTVISMMIKGMTEDEIIKYLVGKLIPIEE